ncbi:MAG TPA: hypothetical protein VF795_12040 [Desulfuromonadaceae bacterium]
MKRLIVKRMCICLASALVLVLPGMTHAQTEQMAAAPPSIGQSLIREGDFAVKLENNLSMGTVQNEADAENRLAAVGIMPKNGWIADYPVTPDILDEVSIGVRNAADAGRIPLTADVALQRLNDVMAQAGLSMRTPSEGDANVPQLAATEDYPSAGDISDYYYDAGPPVITYYAPPPEYYYLYGWVPFPFWCDGAWFPGYFILHDFDRHVHFGDRDRFVSNHFNDERHNRIFRVDPIARLNGRTTALGRVRPMAGFRSGGASIVTNLRGRGLPASGMAVRPTIGPTIVRGGVSSIGRMAGYGYHGPAVTSGGGFATFRNGGRTAVVRSRTPGGIPMRGGQRFGMPARGYGFAARPSQGSGFTRVGGFARSGGFVRGGGFTRGGGFSRGGFARGGIMRGGVGRR